MTQRLGKPLRQMSKLESPPHSGQSVPELILASSSPRRRELLDGIGVRFQVRPQKVDEARLVSEPPSDYVLRLAGAKAGSHVEPGELVLGADTVVLIDSDLLGKPRDAEQAAEMLRRLSGREHTVLTAVVLCDAGAGRQASTLERSRVRMAALSRKEIEWYVATGEPLDKAGAYAVQGLGGLFVEAVFGNYTNVVGLPLPATSRLFRELGYDLRHFRADPPSS